MKNKKYIASIMSFFVWGSGQFFICRQRIKGLVIFALQALVVGIELGTGYWLEYLTGQFTDFSLRLHGGFFSKGIWGLITLGEKPRYDHSAMLLINGVITLIILAALGVIFLWNVADAFKTAGRIERDGYYISSREYGRKVYHKMFAYVVLTPIAVLFVFVVAMPIIFACLTAFLNYNRDNLPPGNLLSWTGLANFRKLFDVPIWSDTFFQVLLWNVIWALSVTFITYFVGLFQAMILNHRCVRGKKLFQTILILPWAIPQMISLLVFRNMFNGQFGPVNQFLLDAGMISERIPFLTDPVIAKITVIGVAVWLGFPMFMVMMLGVFANIDQSLYEAAATDGANKFQIFRRIQMPLVFLTTAPLLVMNMAGNFNGFGLIYFLTKGGPTNPSYQFAGDTDILISWIYKLTLDQQMYNMAAVMSVLIFIFIGAVSFWNFKRTTSFKEL